jgi:hypothetical protein
MLEVGAGAAARSAGPRADAARRVHTEQQRRHGAATPPADPGTGVLPRSFQTHALPPRPCPASTERPRSLRTRTRPGPGVGPLPAAAHASLFWDWLIDDAGIRRGTHAPWRAGQRSRVAGAGPSRFPTHCGRSSWLRVALQPRSRTGLVSHALLLAAFFAIVRCAEGRGLALARIALLPRSTAP